MPAPPTLPWLAAPPGPTRVGRPRRRRVRLSERARRLGAAILAALGVASALLALRPPPAPHVVLTVRAALPAGHVLTARDLASVHVHTQARPDEAIDSTDHALGRRLSRPVGAHTILTAIDLARPHDLAHAERAVHVPVVDPGALLALRPGDRVDLVETGGGRTVAENVRVITVDDPTAEGSPHGLLVAVPASRLAALVPAMSATGAGVVPALRDALVGQRPS